MDGVPEPHDRMLRDNLLHKWQPGMFVTFISHQWLGSSHPDPQGQQCAVLRAALQGMIDGTLKVEADPVTIMNRKIAPFSAGAREQVANGYIFFDWLLYLPWELCFVYINPKRILKDNIFMKVLRGVQVCHTADHCTTSRGE